MPNRIKKKPLTKPSKNPAADDYQIVIRWSDADGCFLGSAPALEGCVTHGASPEAALQNAREAAALWLASAAKHGQPIPRPTHHYSGRMTLRMPVSLHQQVVEQAEREGVSINQWVITRLAR